MTGPYGRDRNQGQETLAEITDSPALRRAPEELATGDDPAGAFALLADGAQRGLGGALVTIIGIEGGAPRALGAHMAVLEDGAYCGYVSGGCIEPAIAAEVLRVLRHGKDTVLRFGAGSPFIDINLPCGGGIDLHVHVRPAPNLIDAALSAFSRREPFAIDLDPEGDRATFVAKSGGKSTSGREERVFRRHYAPATQLILVGRGLEYETLMRMARSGGFPLTAYSPDSHALRLADRLGVAATALHGLSDAPALPIDPWTAVVLLFHDHGWETRLLMQAIESEAFFVGALGSRNTHTDRCARLLELGASDTAIARIKGPVGLFGPTRNATSLAVSVLSQIVEERRALDDSA